LPDGEATRKVVLLMFFLKKIVQSDIDAEFEDPPDARRSFKAHYRRFIRPHLERLEEKRVAAMREAQKRTRQLILPAIGISILCLAMGQCSQNNHHQANRQTVSYESRNTHGLQTHTREVRNDHRQGERRRNKNESGEGILGLWVLLVGGMYWWASGPVRAYRATAKDTLMPEVLKFFGDDFRFSARSPLSIRSLKPSGIIPAHDNARTEDHITGTYKGVGLELMEAYLTQTKKEGKKRKTITVFKGMIVLLDIHKRFEGHTIIVKDHGVIGNSLKRLGVSFRLETVRLEDPTFEREFEVYSSDQVEARYLLTPSFMVRLLELRSAYESGTLRCSFYDNRLMLMIPTISDHFEITAIDKPATFVEDIRVILQQMDEILAIIDTLKLNERTGL
jgi:hypothetical protein